MIPLFYFIIVDSIFFFVQTQHMTDLTEVFQITAKLVIMGPAELNGLSNRCFFVQLFRELAMEIIRKIPFLSLI
jgi:hypothetical protein